MTMLRKVELSTPKVQPAFPAGNLSGNHAEAQGAQSLCASFFIHIFLARSW